MKKSGYDQLARYYRAIETIAFGRALERARFHHLEKLRECRRILLLGDGDGRALAAACKAAPDAHFDSLDFSAGMIAQAKQRVPQAEHARITWIHANALTANYPAGGSDDDESGGNGYDAVVSLFFLDCFSDAQVAAFIERVKPALTANAIWLHADFSLPPRGRKGFINAWSRFRARVLLWMMLRFFRMQTGLQIRALPESEALLVKAGFRVEAETDWQGGFIRSVVFRR